jgi:hypothetical protein
MFEKDRKAFSTMARCGFAKEGGTHHIQEQPPLKSCRLQYIKIVMLDSSLPLDIWNTVTGFLERPPSIRATTVSNLKIVMLDSSLPLDIWSTINGFLEILDLYSLLTTSKEIHSTVDQDVIYEQFAKRKFPLYLLDTSVYEKSWKKLVQDDNAKNGYYRLQLNAPSFLKRSDDHIFYLYMIRTIAWDRQANEIILEVEGFGENDLREASGIAFFWVHPIQADEWNVPLVKIRCENYEYNGPSHQLCRIYLDANQFLPGYTYKFTYGDPRPVRSVYNYDHTFLAGSDFRSLPELFKMPSLQERLKELTTIMRSSGYNGPIDAGLVERQRRDNASLMTMQPSRACDFVSQSTPLQPSNVLEWEGVSLPREMRERHGRGEWGTVQLAP